MRLAVVSDTHGHYENAKEAVRQMEALDVNLVLHCGDIGTPDIIDLFDKWPTHFVFGNCDYDHWPLEQAIQASQQTSHGLYGELNIEGVKIALLHSHDHFKFREVIHSEDFDLVCYGHTHRAEQHKLGRTTVLNPGALFRANPHSFAIVDLPSLQIEQVKLAM
jgi:hypothetical protein